MIGIENMREGRRLEPPEEPPVHCPVCGDECRTLYRDSRFGEIFGCDQCVDEQDEECYEQDAEEYAEDCREEVRFYLAPV